MFLRGRSRSKIEGPVKLIIVIFGVLTLAACGPQIAPQRTIGNIYYVDSSGTVGNHLSSYPKARCGGVWGSSNGRIIKGTLPPGLKIYQSTISGTPQSPGQWTVHIKFTTIICQGAYSPDQTVIVNFNISGDSPKSLR